MTAALTRDDHAALDLSLERLIVPTATTLSVGYLVAGIAHVLAGGTDRALVGSVELISVGVLCLGLWKYRGRSLRAPTLYRIAAAVAGLVLANAFIFHSQYREAQHPYVIYVLTLGLGITSALPRRYYASLVAGCGGVVAISCLRSVDPLRDWLEPSLVLLAVFALSLALRRLLRDFFLQVKNLHLENEQNLAARDAARSRYRTLTDMASDLIAELDEHGRVLYANPAHTQVFGIEPSELIGMEIFAFLKPRIASNEQVDFSMLTTQPLGPLEIHVKRRDGTPIVVEMNTRPYLTEANERRIVVNSRDVTARANAEVERARRREELERVVEERTQALARSMNELQRSERLAAVGTLSAGIAHQINNPIGGILLSSQFALAEIKSGSTSLEVLISALEVNEREARRCGEIVRNLLTFARNEPAKKTTVVLGDLLRRVVELCRPYATSQMSTLSLSLDAESVGIHANAVEIEEAIINLIRNAVESNEKDVNVGIALSRSGEMASIEVTDNGVGMTSEQCKHIFDPFYTTRLEHGGTGLGLSVAHGIAVDHHGSLSVESEIGRGSRIRLELPVQT